MLAVVLALAAAAAFGTGTALQHRAASGVPGMDAPPGRLLSRLLRRRSWLAGLCLSAVGFALHVAALHYGPLSLVQPIVVTTTVFAVFVRSALDRMLPDRAEVVWSLCTLAGLTLFIATVGTRGGDHQHGSDRAAAMFLVAGAVVAAVASLLARQTRVPARRGFLLGVAAGILYGLTAGLVKLATSHARFGFGPLLHHWSSWLVVPTGLSAFFLSQSAYQATRLSVSAPVLNIVDVLVAVTFGSVVFRDHLFHSVGQLVLELIGVTMIGVGVWRLVMESELLHERQMESARLERAASPVVDSGRDAS